MSKSCKLCERCGRGFSRNRKYGRTQWELAKFCSRACSFPGKHDLALQRHINSEPIEKAFNRFVSYDGECWEWIGPIGAYGYGYLNHAGKRYRAHVLALILDGKEVPKGKLACHHCDNPKCVRATHLYVGTPATNSRDQVIRGRTAKGEKNANAKLTETDVLEIRHLTGSYTDIAREFGVSRPTVTRAIKRETWKHIQ